MNFSPDYQRSLRERDWAPFGGTSQNTARQLTEALHRAVMDTVTARLSQYPGLTGRYLDRDVHDRMPTLQWNLDREGAYIFYVTLEHAVNRPPSAMPTKVRVTYRSDTRPDAELVDVWMTDDTARDPEMIADMVLGAADRHGRSIGYGTTALGDTKTVVHRWSTAHGDCYDCGVPAAYRIDGNGEKVCAVCAADRAADGETITRLTDA